MKIEKWDFKKISEYKAFIKISSVGKCLDEFAHFISHVGICQWPDTC